MLHIKKIKPLFTSIITTGDRYEKDDMVGAVVFKKKGDLKMYQRVIAVGTAVRDIHVGDMVMIDPSNYIVRKYDKNSIQNDLDNNPTVKVQFNWVSIDDEHGVPQDCLLLSDRDIQFVFEGEEVEESQAPSLIIPEKAPLIVN